jgi:hypothetical protein
VRDVDAIIEQLKLAHPGISAEQLAVSHPSADDNGVWFFRHPGSAAEIQMESATGNAPFLIESSMSRDHCVADTVPQVVALVVAGLGLPSPAA